MPRKKIYFAGLLANTDSSILNVRLDHGFKIKGVSDKEGYSLFSNLESLPYEKVGTKLFMDFPCFNPDEKKFYFIHNSFESIDKSGSKILNTVTKLDKFVHDYLTPNLQLMRLFKEGNICMPLIYFYLLEKDIPKPTMRGSTPLYIEREPYTLKHSEISDLEKFIRNTKLPFTESFLQLAFGNFELSHQIQNINLSFLSLMSSLEALFNRGQPELSYTISRNTAVLLGKNIQDSKKIFQEIKELYNKRSDIIPSRKSNIINKDDLLRLRHYVRESIKEIYDMGKNKDNIFDLLNSSGFGDRPWRK